MKKGRGSYGQRRTDSTWEGDRSRAEKSYIPYVDTNHFFRKIAQTYLSHEDNARTSMFLLRTFLIYSKLNYSLHCNKKLSDCRVFACFVDFPKASVIHILKLKSNSLISELAYFSIYHLSLAITKYVELCGYYLSTVFFLQ